MVVVAGYAKCCIEEGCGGDSGARIVVSPGGAHDSESRSNGEIDGTWCWARLASLGKTGASGAGNEQSGMSFGGLQAVAHVAEYEVPLLV